MSLVELAVVFPRATRAELASLLTALERAGA